MEKAEKQRNQGEEGKDEEGGRGQAEGRGEEEDPGPVCIQGVA